VKSGGEAARCGLDDVQTANAQELRAASHLQLPAVQSDDGEDPSSRGSLTTGGLRPARHLMTRNHIVHAASNVISIGLLTVFFLMFLALFFSCQAPDSTGRPGVDPAHLGAGTSAALDSATASNPSR
jgi:hypothetical protein